MSEEEPTTYKLETTDKREMKLAMEAAAWRSIAYDIDMWLRNKIKYGEGHHVDAAARLVVFEEARAELWSLINGEGLSFDE